MLLVLAAPGFADQVDDYIREEMKKQHIPGLSFAVVNDGKLVKSGGYGVANVELNAPAKPETVYQLQSITKSFTATGVLLLVEEDKVGVDDKISKHLDGLPDTWKEITVRHLLTHTSGIKDFINEPTVDLRKDITPQDVIKSLADKPLNFQPGERYAYCNTGYLLLGMIIRKTTGQPYGEFLHKRIFQPLGMKNTRVISLKDIIPKRASGYSLQDGKIIRGEYVAESILSYPGGGLLSTVLDMAKYEGIWLHGQLLDEGPAPRDAHRRAVTVKSGAGALVADDQIGD